MKWISVQAKEKPDLGSRVLVFSKDAKGSKYRILDERFLSICIDVTHWQYLTSP